MNYATSDGTAHAGERYQAVSGTLTFAPGVLSQSFNVPIIDDNIITGNGTVSLTLSARTGHGHALVSPSARR